MAHESFENPDVAALMNGYFIDIKVDREECPDLDGIYQKSAQVLTGWGGGWPVTVFLTPDQEPCDLEEGQSGRNVLPLSGA
jgi:uncharacterized protein YyaL (SSP411 family)